MKHIVFTVTNDLNNDRRMIRICSSLAQNGYRVTLAGVAHRSSQPLVSQSFQQRRLKIIFSKGPAFYAEYNLRMFLFLLRISCEAICSIDADSLPAGYLASRLKGVRRIYDAHEYFSEMKEVITRPRVHRTWKAIERWLIPKYPFGYTVSGSISKRFAAVYGVNYETIRNVPFYIKRRAPAVKLKNIVYQGAVNEARGFEALIPAMRQIDATLYIYGAGNFTRQTIELIEQNRVQDKVKLMGMVSPKALETVTSEAYIGINLVENVGLNQYYSLANKFFDYIMHGVPQVTMDFPEYAAVNAEYEVALLVKACSADAVAAAINKLLHDDALYARLKENCVPAALIYNWETEEKKLLAFYKTVFE